jgi:hypothetical protein
MTATPVEPTPTTDPAPEPPAAATTPPASPEPPKPKAPEPTTKANPWEDPEAAQAEIERLRKENAKDRTNAKAQAAEDARKELAQSIAKILDPDATEPTDDPVKLAESLTASQSEAKAARVELAVFKAAGAAGGDPAALLDSSSFLASLDSIDPTDTAAITDAIKAAVGANPRLGAAPGDPKVPAPNPAQGTSAGGPGAAGQLTEADVKRLYAEGKHDEIVKAKAEGRLATYLAS